MCQSRGSALCRPPYPKESVRLSPNLTTAPISLNDDACGCASQAVSDAAAKAAMDPQTYVQLARPKITKVLHRHGLEWADVAPVLSQLDTVDEVEASPLTTRRIVVWTCSERTKCDSGRRPRAMCPLRPHPSPLSIPIPTPAAHLRDAQDPQLDHVCL